MKILTAEQMRDADRLTIASGIPGLILMENAACRVVDFLVERFSPLGSQRITIVCGKGNNGGDGLAIARQLLTRFAPARLDVFLVGDLAAEGTDARANYDMFLAVGGTLADQIDPCATLVIDALLGTGLRGPATGVHLEWMDRMNTAFPFAKVVAVDVPSGHVRANHTVTFAAPKVGMPGSPSVGELIVARIGIPDKFLQSQLQLSELSDFSTILAPRKLDSHKGTYGHVLVAGGAPGKTGAAALAGMAALRAGAGWVTVASAEPVNAQHPELMSAPLNADGLHLDRITVLAIGPGIGQSPEMVDLVRRSVRESALPIVIDADGLNAIAGLSEKPFNEGCGPRILTPHPGEMSRLMQVTGDRVADACTLAARWHCCVVLKGAQTVIAYPNSDAWINPTGSPALAKAGSGDILTGVVAGLVAQFPGDWELAVRCAVYLHGRAGQLAAKDLGEKAVISTDLLRYLYADL